MTTPNGPSGRPVTASDAVNPEAVIAAWKAYCEANGWSNDWDKMSPAYRRDYLALLTPVVAAAAPHLHTACVPQTEVDRLRVEAERHELETIKERDAFHEAADRLAYAIAPVEVTGEHSTANDPWVNALDEAAALHARLAACVPAEALRRLLAEHRANIEGKYTPGVEARYGLLGALLGDDADPEAAARLETLIERSLPALFTALEALLPKGEQS